jgi:hypothetical protein
MRVLLVRFLVPVLVLCGGVAWGPAPVHAGIVPSTPLCGDSADILDFFSGATFTGLSNCESLCKKVYEQCKSFLNKSKSCEKSYSEMGGYFEKKGECDSIEDPASRKDCKQAVDQNVKDAKGAVDAEDSAAKDGCLSIRDTCIDSCNPPL